MAGSEESSNRNNVFDSVDFNTFLHQKLMKSTDSVNAILGPGDLSLFKSKESFVSGFLSKDWEANSSSTSALRVVADEKPLNAAENSNTTTTIPTATNSPTSKDGKSMIQKSQDWIKFNTLGKHVEIPISMGMFSSTGVSRQQSQASQASIPIPSPPSIQTGFAIPLSMNVQENHTAATSIPKMASTVKNTKKKKRKRAPRKKIFPENKQYLTPTDKDVLMGRGGKSNHHPGNMQYRTEIDNLQVEYKKTEDKDEKTKISEKLVSRVQSYGGNFVEKDDNGWYVIDDIVARRKVSQALREDKDPEKRRAKRQRFLAKRSRLEEEEARKKDASMRK